MLTPDWGKFWLEALTLLGVMGNMLYTFITNRSKANTKAIKELRGHIDVRTESISERVDTIELDVRELRTDLRHLPDEDDIKRLHQRIDGVAQGMTRLEGSHDAHMRAINKNLDLINTHLLSRELGEQKK